MNITNENMIAKIAAVVAGLGLVMMSFAAFAPSARAQTNASLQAQIQALLAQIAALQAQIAGGTSVGVTPFTRDLTIGSTGADVTRLQQWLIARGHSIPAGATGYFGTQTRAAVAAFQASQGITPTAGYFGPITRARVNTMLSVTPGPTTPTPDDDDPLEGGEASLTDYELSRENSSVNEGETEAEIATAEFDVDRGDVRVERVELTFEPVTTGGSEDEDPWDYIERIVVLADGDEVGEADVDSRGDWDEGDVDDDNNDDYTVTITGIDHIVREGDRAELTFAVDVRRNIDSNDMTQDFNVFIGDRGIRAVDSEGIQHYVGDEDESVTFGFDEMATGDLNVRTSSEDPDATTLIADEDDESDEYTVFVFELENDEDVDVLVTDLSIGINSSTDGDDFIEDAMLIVDGDEVGDGDIAADTIDFDDVDFEVGGDETVEVELVITLQRNVDDITVSFDIDGGADITAESVDEGDDTDVGGSATSETHTIAQTGLQADSGSTDADANDNGTIGTFRITFEVTALEDDVYIYNGADTASSTTSGVIYNIYTGNSQTFSGTASDLLRSSADRNGDYYVVREGQTEEFTLTVTLDPDTGTALYYVELEAIRFDTAADASAVDDATYTVPNTRAFETNAVSLSAS